MNEDKLDTFNLDCPWPTLELAELLINIIGL